MTNAHVQVLDIGLFSGPWITILRIKILLFVLRGSGLLVQFKLAIPWCLYLYQIKIIATFITFFFSLKLLSYYRLGILQVIHS